MKITQEVKEFAKLNPPAHPEEGLSLSKARLEGQEAEAGMAEMSKRFHDEGGEIYLPAAE